MLPARLASALALLLTVAVFADDKPRPPAGCAAAMNNDFEAEVWAKVGSQKCLTCHRAGGDAEESKFVLIDPKRAEVGKRDEAMRHNRAAFTRMAVAKDDGKSRLLRKVVGELDHGGMDVLKADSAGYRALVAFVRRAAGQTTAVALDPKAPPFFDGVVMLDDRRLLRRATLSLAGRLPTAAEFTAVAKGGAKALPATLDAVMKEDAFFDRLREGYNDIFLTVGLDGNAETSVLAYEHFEKSRLWYQKYDLSHIQDQKQRTQAGYKLANDYRKALLGEPMKLIEYVVRNDRPFTEIVTADYILVTPFSARGYGVFDQLKGTFKNPDDPFEYVPVKLTALASRDKNSKEGNQDSATGFYPHAGLLAMFQYLARYPTTETNRNRLRARMYYQHFLGVDVLELAARVSDAAAATAKYKVPTMQAAECVVCHKTLDPVAGLFQDYWRFDANFALYGKRKGGWFTDMFAAGFEGEPLPQADRWRALQWLGERTAKDPRFAVAMTEHVYYLLTGRRVLLPPKDFDDPLYPARARAYAEQRRTTERIAADFANNGFNLKRAFHGWIASDWYRADGPAMAIQEACRRAELEDVGVMRLLSPEQVERKVAAVFGQKWGKLNGELAVLYGGIDSQEVTDRATDPSGAMGAIQRLLSNDVACRHVARDFAKPAAVRTLFPGIELDVIPGGSADGDRRIRAAVVYLHDRVLGRADAPDSAEVSRTVKLFAAVVADAKERKGIDKRESYNCRPDRDAPGAGDNAADPHYTLRAWRAVVTYLLRRPEFLYE